MGNRNWGVGVGWGPSCPLWKNGTPNCEQLLRMMGIKKQCMCVSEGGLYSKTPEVLKNKILQANSKLSIALSSRTTVFSTPHKVSTPEETQHKKQYRTSKQILFCMEILIICTSNIAVV